MKFCVKFCVIFTIYVNNLQAQYYGGALYHLKYGYTPQSYWKYYDPDYQDYQQGLLTSKKRENLKIKEISIQHTDKKGKNSQVILTYNKIGRLLTSKSKRFERTSQYLHDSIEIYRFTKFKNKTEEFKKSFNEDGKLLVDERFKNGKLISKTENTYINSQLINAKLFQNGKLYEMIYTYNSENKLVKTEFLKNKKVKQSWVYECKPEGELTATTKTEILSSKCEYREESLDGSYAVFTRTIRDSKPYLEKQTFTKDSIKIRQEYFVNDTVLTYRWSFENKIELKENFKKGKLISYDKSILNNQNKCIEQVRYKRNKLKKMWKYDYDVNGNQILNEFYKKNKLKFSTKSQYDQFGNKVLEQHSNRKNKKVSSKRVNQFNQNGTLKEFEYYDGEKLRFTKKYEYVFY